MGHTAALLAKLAIASALASTLWGCSKKIGEPHPPASYGPIQRVSMGCPRFKHAYAWPPAEGTMYPRSGAPGSREPSRVMGIPFYGPAELVIEAPNALGEAMLKTHALRAEATAIATGPGWGYTTVESQHWGCSGGSLWIDGVEPELDRAERGIDFATGAPIKNGPVKKNANGESTSIRWLLTPMKDGSLALGRRMVVTGRTEYLFSWGDASALSHPAPPLEAWQWSRLKAIPMQGRESKP